MSLRFPDLIGNLSFVKKSILCFKHGIAHCRFFNCLFQVMNLLLGGAAVQGSRKLLTAWLAWHLTLVLLYWVW